MIYRQIIAAWLFTVAALGAAAQEAPGRIPPAPPKVQDLLPLTPYDLARGYLAAQAALPLAKSASDGLGVLNLGIDGKEYRVDTTNAAQFIPLLEDRVKLYGEAIAARGAAKIDGQYTFAAGPGCKGEKFDPRLLFAAGSSADGTPLMATTARIIQSGLDTNLLVTFTRGREVLGEFLSGTTVENTIIFTKVMGNGFSIYGTAKDNGIELELDPEEVKGSIGARAGTDADWQGLATCVFTLTKR
jgi:hypothetical protein